MLAFSFWPDFNETLLEHSIPRDDAYIIFMSWLDHSAWVLIPDYLWFMYKDEDSFLCCFFGVLIGFQWNFVGTFKTERRYTFSCQDWTIQLKSVCPWLVMHYVYRVTFVFPLLLCNYWPDICESLWERSILKTDTHISFSCLVWIIHLKECWLLISYTLCMQILFISTFIFNNYWPDFSETL